MFDHNDKQLNINKYIRSHFNLGYDMLKLFMNCFFRPLFMLILPKNRFVYVFGNYNFGVVFG